VFTFPADYIPRLWHAIEIVDPEFAEDLRAFKAKQDGGSKHNGIE
jgi:hypothetical protein